MNLKRPTLIGHRTMNLFYLMLLSRLNRTIPALIVELRIGARYPFAVGVVVL